MVDARNGGESAEIRVVYDKAVGIFAPEVALELPAKKSSFHSRTHGVCRPWAL
jgi:hypothetical protein